MLGEPQVLRQLQVLGQLSVKVLDCELSDQSPPGGITSRRVSQKVSPVSQPHVIKTAGNLQRQTWRGCQS